METSLPTSDVNALNSAILRPWIKARCRYLVLGYSNRLERWERIFGQFLCYKDARKWIKAFFPSMVQSGDYRDVKIRKTVVFKPQCLVLDDSNEVAVEDPALLDTDSSD